MHLVLSSCIRDTSSKQYNEIDSLINKRLVLPDDESDSILLYNPYGITINKLAKIKIVTYIDANCPKCLYNLSDWEHFISSVRSENLEFYFYIYAANYSEVKRVLKEVEFANPVFFDSSNKFLNLNKLHNFDIYNTVLLNNDSKIQLVGSPLLNKEMNKLYNTVIFK